MEFIQNIDFSILNWIYDNVRNDFLDVIMPLITMIGAHGLFFIILSIFLICTKKYRKVGITMAIAISLGFIFGNLLLKPLVGRIRPYDITPNINMLVNALSDYSFPSGHTLSSFAVATVILCFNKKIGIFAMIIATLIGFSRLYLYVHFPTDVLCGAILGILFGKLSYKFISTKYKSTKAL